jgi:hypothetical protein
VAWTGDATIWIDDAGVKDATTLDPSTFNPGKPGTGGPGGEGGAPGSSNGITGVPGVAGAPGPNGISKAVAEF